MNLRLALSVVFVGTLAYACGPRSGSDVIVERSTNAPQGVALASMTGGGMRPTNTVEKTLKRTPETLAMRFDVASEGSDVRFQLHVVNTTAKNVEVNFPSGQAYDFIVVDSIGREVWRWADGRAFTQSVQNKLLGKGKSISVTEKWSATRTGKFTAIAMLLSTRYPVEQKVAFERK
jgi:intracellular proteinase inhibitor BsuPI